uniref:Uncharacterized protein n=1 Tax=Pectinophora gossypiella TaxID=13191 RepID=A0A1E1WBV6_PECGO
MVFIMLDNKSSLKRCLNARETREAVSCGVSEQQLESTAPINRWWGVGLDTHTYITYIALHTRRIKCKLSEINLLVQKVDCGGAGRRAPAPAPAPLRARP